MKILPFKQSRPPFRRAHRWLQLWGRVAFAARPGSADGWKIPPHRLGDLAAATFESEAQMNASYFGDCLAALPMDRFKALTERK